MSLFRDIQSEKWLYAKGVLFCFLAVVAGVLLVLRMPQPTTLVLLAICVWASCRAYYFAFYVIEHYTDSEFRYSGLIDFAKHLWQRRSHHDRVNQEGQRSTHD